MEIENNKRYEFENFMIEVTDKPSKEDLLFKEDEFGICIYEPDNGEDHVMLSHQKFKDRANLEVFQHGLESMTLALEHEELQKED